MSKADGAAFSGAAPAHKLAARHRRLRLCRTDAPLLVAPTP
jgi:hypothetical protein